MRDRPAGAAAPSLPTAAVTIMPLRLHQRQSPVRASGLAGPTRLIETTRHAVVACHPALARLRDRQRIATGGVGAIDVGHQGLVRGARARPATRQSPGHAHWRCGAPVAKPAWAAMRGPASAHTAIDDAEAGTANCRWGIRRPGRCRATELARTDAAGKMDLVGADRACRAAALAQGGGWQPPRPVPGGVRKTSVAKSKSHRDRPVSITG